MSKPTFDNRNENRISIKTDSTVKLIKELSKLGVFKTKKKPKRKLTDTGMEGIKQDNEMVGYTKSLSDTLGPQMRNIPPIQQIEAGMTQQQIEDIQRTNNATIAALTGEIRQQRLEDIEAQQGQRFKDITKLGGIINPLLERFRGSTFPAQEQGDQPIDPFSSSRPDVILLGNEPDVIEERFTQTLNPGGPEAVAKAQTTIFAEGEQPGFIPEPRIKPQERIRKVRTKNEQRNFVAKSWGLPQVPDEKLPREIFRKYYFDLALASNEDINPELKTKEDYIREIKALLDLVGIVIPSEK